MSLPVKTHPVLTFPPCACLKLNCPWKERKLKANPVTQIQQQWDILVPVACVRPSSFYGLSAYKSHLILEVYLLQEYVSSIYGKAKTTPYVWLGKGAGHSAHHTKHSETGVWWTWDLAKRTVQGYIRKGHISVHFANQQISESFIG